MGLVEGTWHFWLASGGGRESVVMSRWLAWFWASVGCVFLFQGSGCYDQAGSARSRAVRFAITDVEGLEQLQREFGAFRDLLEQRTGMNIKLFPVSDRTAAVTALENDQIDLVLTGPAEYVIFRSRTEVRPLAGLYRPDYTAVFLVRKKDGITLLSELRGKRIALGPLASTSKHLAPLQMLADVGVGYTEIEPFHTGIRPGWDALLHGDVAAFATTKDKWLLLAAAEPDSGIVLLAESAPLPMDVLLASARVPHTTSESIRTAISSASEEFVSAILTGEDNQKYRGMQFRLEITDADYDNVRTMFRSAGLQQFAVR